MDLVYLLAKYTVIIEFSLIIMIIALTYILMLIERYKKKRKDKLILDVSNYLAQLISANTPMSNFSFQKSWKRIDVIVPVLYKFERLVQDENWEKTRLQIITSILLPLARKATLRW